MPVRNFVRRTLSCHEENLHEKLKKKKKRNKEFTRILFYLPPGDFGSPREFTKGEGPTPVDHTNNP